MRPLDSILSKSSKFTRFESVFESVSSSFSSKRHCCCALTALSEAAAETCYAYLGPIDSLGVVRGHEGVFHIPSAGF